MFSEKKPRRVAGVLSACVGVAGVTALLGATHPALAAAALAKAQSTVTCATQQIGCVNGTNTSFGPGVLGTSSFGTGVTGKSNTNAGVVGTSTSYYGIHATSQSNDGLLGETSSGLKSGVVGSSPGGDGVFGETTALSGYNAGLYGLSAGAFGVIGTTNGGGTGVLADSPTNGVGLWGRSVSGDGVQATSQSGTGLYASGHPAVRVDGAVMTNNVNGNGAEVSGSYIGLLARAPSNGWPLVLTDSANNLVFYVDGNGNLNYRGGLSPFARVTGGAQIRAFSPKTTLPTIEDTGTAQLVGGSGIVRLDPAFAASIDRSSAYRVFLTPDGDVRGLFVAEKTPNGFVVRESQGGRSSIAFDYRIVATAQGQAGQRMALTNPATALPNAAPRALPPEKLPAVPVPIPRPTISERR